MHRISLALLFLIWLPFVQQAAHEPKLAVSLRSMKSSYSIGEKIHLEVQLSNAGQYPLLIRRQLGWGVGRTDILVFDASHKRVFTTFLADELPPPPTQADFLELAPGQFFGDSVTDSATLFVNVPGTYEFAVDYTSTVSQEWAHKYIKLPNVPLWSRERGTVTSLPIKIVITK